jgi:hypothetical protein
MVNRTNLLALFKIELKTNEERQLLKNQKASPSIGK